MMYSVKMADSTRKQTPAPSSRVSRVSRFNVAFYWAGNRYAGEWRESPVLTSFEWTRQYFRQFDGGRVMVFGVKGAPPEERPTDAQFRAIGQ